jgi:hypothetical protein
MFLDRELKTYGRELNQLLVHEGKFALVHGEEVSDVFDTFEDAVRAGYQRFGLDPFMVKQIHAIEQVQYFSSRVTPCHT